VSQMKMQTTMPVPHVVPVGMHRAVRGTDGGARAVRGVGWRARAARGVMIVSEVPVIGEG
jgi:hypothetical protein